VSIAIPAGSRYNGHRDAIGRGGDMAEEVDTGMDKGDMMATLKYSKKEPVNFAFGMGEETTFALLVLDKHRPGKRSARRSRKNSPRRRTSDGGAPRSTPRWIQNW